ncbi:MAG: hypothetical protein IKL60_01895 [Alistipes sp.]|nr:hypothetical protein [Alistipes sp.]
MHFAFFIYTFAAVKWAFRYKAYIAYLLAAVLVISLSSRTYLTYNATCYDRVDTEETTSVPNRASFVCNCPICSAEEFFAIEAEEFDYHPIIAVLEFEQEILPTASANRVVVISSLRAPPYLS